MGRSQCPHCSSTKTIHDGDTVACAECGYVFEQSQIVSEVTFGETSSGAATVQGSYVSADQAGARIMGPGGFRGSSAGESRQITLANAQANIRKMANIWNLSENVINKAYRIFNLAMVGGGEWLREHADPSNFVLGRKSDITVASCLYLACRHENRPLMLIDFADSIGENVFTLGRSYLKLTRMIHLKPPPGTDGASTIVDPSIYIQRFAIMLDFGDEAPKVTADALRLIKRFNADWMVQGRRPAGICAAALILAARMNHFRRSIAEVVQVARIADVTLRKRLDEFAKTESSKLSVADFRSLWLENAHDPPAFYEPIEAAKRKKRKADAMAKSLTAEEDDDSVVPQGRRTKRKTGSKGKYKEIAADDADEEADDEADLADDETEAAALGASRQIISQAQRQIHDAEADAEEEEETPEQALARARQLETEAEFDRLAEEDVAALLERPELSDTARELEARETARIARARALPLATQSERGEDTTAWDSIDPRLRAGQDGNDGTEQTEGPDTEEAGSSRNRDGSHGSDGEEDGTAREGDPDQAHDATADKEGDNDDEEGDDSDSDSDIEELDSTRVYAPRVRKRSMSAPILPEEELVGLDEEELDMYIATPAEVKIKERVWIEFNRDYLEKELNKQLKIELLEKQGIPTAKREQRKRKPRDSSTPMARTAAEATQKMMQQNKKFSRKLNYDILNAMFDQKPSAKAGGSKSKGHSQSSRNSRRDESDQDDDDEDENDELEDDDDEDGGRALSLGSAGVVDERGQLNTGAASSRSRNSRSKGGSSRKKAGSSSRSRRSSTGGGRSSGADTDGATTDAGETTDPNMAEYRRIVGGFANNDDGAIDEWF
ncbi:transcription factor TFIIIB subunit brf1 [Tilletia horrida]|nr:transcription factor TFIIIB subunit brf1 [Tilletia horrida]